MDTLRVAYLLSTTLPNIISVDFSPSASRNVLRGQILDIQDSMLKALQWQTSKPAVSFEDWLAARGEPDLQPSTR